MDNIFDIKKYFQQQFSEGMKLIVMPATNSGNEQSFSANIHMVYYDPRKIKQSNGSTCPQKVYRQFTLTEVNNFVSKSFVNLDSYDVILLLTMYIYTYML